MDILNKKYTNRAYLQVLALKMRASHQVKYVILDDFLSAEFYEHLMKEIETTRHTLVGDTEGRQIHYVSGHFSNIFWKFYKGKEMKEFLSCFYGSNIRIEGLLGGSNVFQKFLNIFFRKGGMFLRKNIPYSHLDWHTDGPESKIAGSFILYLNKAWESSWGGNLELGYPSPLGIHSYREISPIGNRCILLVCEENISWHHVSRVTGKNSRLFIHDQILYI